MAVVDKNWVDTAVIYQIYPRSFKDANGDGIGDLKGIIEKLDYLNDITKKSLGIDAIWLSPIYPSPMIDFGYDITDYEDIDPIFGNLDDFDKLIKEAHKRNIKVMMDYVPNHTSTQHRWFKESASSKENKKRDWYIWGEPKPDGSPPNNWLSVFGGSVWQWHEKSKQYYLHTFSVDQPDLNWRNPDVVERMLDVLRFWMERGVDGFRVDVPYFIFKDPRFLDEPENPTYAVGHYDPWDKLQHPYTFGLPESLDMMRKFVEVLEEYENKFMVTEAYVSLQELVKKYRSISRDWYAPFNFSMITLPWKASAHRQYTDEYDREVGNFFYPTHVTGNHDKPRVASRIGSEQSRIAAILTLTLRGIPFIYYGDELGMKNVDIPKEFVQDTWEKSMPGMGMGRDPERTPMQWDASENAGFTTGTPWLPLSNEHKYVNVAVERADPGSMLTLYRRLIQYRKNSRALLFGKYVSYDVGNDDVYVYLRVYGKDRVMVVLNFSSEPQKIKLPFVKKASLVLDSSLAKERYKQQSVSTIKLAPNDGYVFDNLI